MQASAATHLQIYGKNVLVLAFSEIIYLKLLKSLPFVETS